MKEAKPSLADLEGEVDTSDAEAVLLHCEASLAIRLAALAEVDGEVKMNVDDVLEGLRTSEGAVLENVVDQEADAEGLLRPRSENLDGTNRGVVASQGATALLLPVRKAVSVQTLLLNLGHSRLGVDLVVWNDERRKTVLKEEDDLVRILLGDLIEKIDELVDVRLSLNDEAVLEAETLCGLAHLKDALLVAVVDGDVTRLGDGIGCLEHDRRLAVAGQTSHHRDGRTSHAITSHEQVHFLHAHGNILLQLLRNVDIEDVRLRGELDASVESIDLHVALLPWLGLAARC